MHLYVTATLQDRSPDPYLLINQQLKLQCLQGLRVFCLLSGQQWTSQFVLNCDTRFEVRC